MAGRKNGKSLLIKTGTPAVTIALQTDCSFSVVREALDVSTKSDNNAEFVAGNFAVWNVEGSSTMDTSETTIDALYTDIDAGNKIAYLRVNVDDEEYKGSAFVTNWSVEGGNDSPITLSYSFQGTGALTKV